MRACRLLSSCSAPGRRQYGTNVSSSVRAEWLLRHGTPCRSFWLSAETAVGKYPHEVLKTVNKICLSTEKHVSEEYSFQPLCNYKSIDYVIAMSTMYAASSLKIKAIIALTESGRTPLWMSRIKTRSTIPIYALSRHVKSRRIMMLYKNLWIFPFIGPKDLK